MEVVGFCGAVFVSLGWLWKRSSGEDVDEMSVVGVVEGDNPGGFNSATPAHIRRWKARFGKPLRKHFFLEWSEVTHLNHGSYGTVPRPVIAAKVAALTGTDKCPEDHFRRTGLPTYKRLVKMAAKVVGDGDDTLVFVPNATTGVHTALKHASEVLGAGDAILSTSYTYNSCRIAAEEIADACGAEVIPMQLGFPLKEDPLDTLKEALATNPHVKIVMLDHISSSTGYLFDIKPMVVACHDAGARVIIDAAHAVGQVAVNVRDIGADYYTTNMHKWMFSGRSLAVLCVDPQHRDSIRPLVCSHFHTHHNLQRRFWNLGTSDHSNIQTVPAALRFMDSLGGIDEVYNRNHALAVWAGRYLSSLWGTEVAMPDHNIASMVVVLTPIPSGEAFLKYGASFMSESEQNPPWAVRKGDMFMATFVHITNIHVAISADPEDRVWLRVSCQVYNDRDDIVKLGQAVMGIAGAVKKASAS